MLEKATRLGLEVAIWAPGDGYVRYRFTLAVPGEQPPPYDASDGIFTALGVCEAEAFLSGFAAARQVRQC
jgi:hypothetical protein